MSEIDHFKQSMSDKMETHQSAYPNFSPDCDCTAVMASATVNNHQIGACILRLPAPLRPECSKQDGGGTPNNKQAL